MAGMLANPLPGDKSFAIVIQLQLSETAMKRDIVCVENFYADPTAVLRYAQGLDYVYPYQQPGTPTASQRITWRASRYKSAGDCPFKSSAALIASLQALTGETIDRDAWNCDFPVDASGYPTPDHRSVMQKSAWWNCCFHAKSDQQQKLGAGVHSHTDHDSWNPVGMDGWAGLIYFHHGSVDPQTGLRTWANRDPRRQFDWMTPSSEWILQDTLANVHNRLILHRGRVPHSGANGWGSSWEDARLFQTFFFRVKQTDNVESLTPKDLRLPA